jgi:hypothetical protein
MSPLQSFHSEFVSSDIVSNPRIRASILKSPSQLRTNIRSASMSGAIMNTCSTTSLHSLEGTKPCFRIFLVRPPQAEIKIALVIGIKSSPRHNHLIFRKVLLTTCRSRTPNQRPRSPADYQFVILYVNISELCLH